MNKKENLIRSMTIVAIGTGTLLLIPFIAMLFTNEVDWDLADFIVMGALLFSTGLSFVLLTKSAGSLTLKFAAAFTLGSTLLMVWANLAVGLIGAGPNAGNLMYMGVLVIGIVVSIDGHFRPAGMARASFAVVIALALLTTIALMTGMQHYPESSVLAILGVNGFFAGLFLISGFLYRMVSKKRSA